MTLHITILGLDAVGTSLGLAFGTLDPKVLDVGRPRVVGWDHDRQALEAARGRLAIDVVEPDLAKALSSADVVVVNVQPESIRQTFNDIVPHLKHGAVVTDTCSVKAPVMEAARELLPATVHFIGGHPFVDLAGPPQAGRLDAFRDVMYCLVPSPQASSGALDGISELISAIGAKPYYIDALEHDSYAAAAAQLPLLTSLALMETVSRGGGWREVQPIAGEGLVRMTELVGDDPQAIALALHANRVALEPWLDALGETLERLRAMLSDQSLIEEQGRHAVAAREAWLRSRPNVRPGEDGLYDTVREVQAPGFTGMFFGRRSPKRKK